MNVVSKPGTNEARYAGGNEAPRALGKTCFRPVEISPPPSRRSPGFPALEVPTIFIETYAPKLVEEGRLTPKEHLSLVRDWKEHTKNPAAFFCSPPMVEIIAVKE